MGRFKRKPLKSTSKI